MSGKVFHGPLLDAHPEFELAAVVERTKKEAKAFHPNIKEYSSLEQLLKDESIGWVVVNTPHFLHFEQAKAALKSGKNVIVEKPLALTVSECQTLFDLAESGGLALTVFQNRRWDSDFLTVKNLLVTGKLTGVTLFESRYDRFRNYIEPNTWKELAGLGAGLVYNLGPHLIDQALVLFGEPLSVWARIRSERLNSQIPDSYLIVLEYQNLEVRLSSSYHIKEEMPRFALHGSGGSFVKFGLDVQEEALKKGIKPGSDNWGKEPESLYGILHTADGSRDKVVSETGDYRAFYNSISAYCHGQSSLPVSRNEAVNVIKVIESAYLSQKEGRVIPFQ